MRKTHKRSKLPVIPAFLVGLIAVGSCGACAHLPPRQAESKSSLRPTIMYGTPAAIQSETLACSWSDDHQSMVCFDLHQSLKAVINSLEANGQIVILQDDPPLEL